jgi:hypothetical protein
MLHQRMHRTQKKGRQEQQDSYEEVSAPSPVPVHPHLPVTGPSNPRTSPYLPDAHLGKRKIREIESADALPPYKRSRTNQSVQTRSNNSVCGLAPLSSPSRCSTPIPLLQASLAIPSTPPIAPLPDAIICQSSRYNPANDQSGPLPQTRQPTIPTLCPRTRKRAEFIDIDLSLEFSGDEQEQEQEAVREEDVHVTPSSKINKIQTTNGDDDTDKTEPDTDADQNGSKTNDDSELDESEDDMETLDYAMPWRRLLPSLPSPAYGLGRHPTAPSQRGNKDQILVPASQSTSSESTGKSHSQLPAQKPQLGLSRETEAGPSQRIDPNFRSVEPTGPLSRREREMDPDTSYIPDSQDNISLLGPPPHSNSNPSSSLSSRIPESSLPQHHELKDKPLSQPSQPSQPLQPSQPSQLTDPDFVPGNASFDDYTDPLEFTIEVGSEPAVSLELKDEVDRLGRVVHYEEVGYVLRDRESLQRSDSGASTWTNATTLVGEYFEAKKEEIEKEMQGLQESQLTRTEGSQGQPSQQLFLEAEGSAPQTTPAPIRPGPLTSTPIKQQHPRPRVDAQSSVDEERKKRLVIAVLDLIAHWLQIEDVRLVHDVWDSLPLHDQTFDRVLSVCLQCGLTSIQTSRRHPSRRGTHKGSGESGEDAGEETESSTRFTALRQQYMIVPNPKRRFPYPKGGDPGHAWTKVICRMLGAMYGFRAQYVHQMWTETGGDICEVERQLEGRQTGWLDLHELELGDVPRPWI